MRFPPLRLLALLLLAPAFLQAEPAEISGLVIPRDDSGMVLRNAEGQHEVSWTDSTRVALVANTRLLAGIEAGVFRYRIHSSDETIGFPLPEGPITGIKTTRGGKDLEEALNAAREEQWLSEFGLALHFGQAPANEQLATEADPRFIGSWDPTVKPRTLRIDGTPYEISLKKGGQTSALLYGILGTADCKPFIHRATVVGSLEDGILLADEIRLLPIGDQAAQDDPGLPRYLFIGDSISGNYSHGLRAALAGKMNLHHPPTNCGPARNGRNNIVAWLGAHDQPRRGWDVISFNFGHWDAGNSREAYQADLEFVIAELEKTGAKLVWVTTCPVPGGLPPAGDLTAEGKAPRRTSGVMEKYLNPWAAEVIARHPAITTCDQWGFVKADAKGLYREWWKGDNVHFGGEAADALGQLLAEHVLGVMGME